jgi:hypothetical protein
MGLLGECTEYKWYLLSVLECVIPLQFFVTSLPYSEWLAKVFGCLLQPFSGLWLHAQLYALELEYRYKEVGEWSPYLLFSYFKERLRSQYPGLDLCSVHKELRVEGI